MMRRMVLQLALASLVPAAPAWADATADFYRGKQVQLVLSAGAGGGYASYAHAIAPYLTKHIPGNPGIVVQNMPGAGGLRAMQYFNTVAPKDGSVLGLVHSSVPFAPLYGIKGASFDPRKFGWIGSINASSAICVSWTGSGVTTWQDVNSKTFIVGGTGAGSQMETMPAMINKLFHTNIKIISGYTGGNDVYLAMERGEVHGRCGGLVSSIQSTRPDWFAKHKVSVPIVVGLKRNPMFPDTPALGELAKDENTKRVLKLVLFPLEMDRPVLVPPGVAPERIAALRKAFHAAMTDPGFIADAEKAKIEIEEVSGERVQEILDDAFSMPPDIVKAASDAMNLSGSKP
jgi:tripartite-type tricarboxylate transporter receptor subunit TctC